MRGAVHSWWYCHTQEVSVRTTGTCAESTAWRSSSGLNCHSAQCWSRSRTLFESILGCVHIESPAAVARATSVRPGEGWRPGWGNTKRPAGKENWRNLRLRSMLGRTYTPSNGRKSQWWTWPDTPESCCSRKPSTSTGSWLKNASTGTQALSPMDAGRLPWEDWKASPTRQVWHQWWIMRALVTVKEAVCGHNYYALPLQATYFRSIAIEMLQTFQFHGELEERDLEEDHIESGWPIFNRKLPLSYAHSYYHYCYPLLPALCESNKVGSSRKINVNATPSQ